MASKYFTQPANIMPGLQMLGRGLESYGEYRSGLAKEQKAQKLRNEATEVFQRGNPDEIASFVGKNPEAKQVFADMVGTEQAAMLDASKRWLINQEDPSQVHIQQAEKAILEGRDPAGNLEMARATMGVEGREQARKMHEAVLSMFDPNAYKNYKKSQGKVEEDVKVGAQEILEDGTVIQSTPQGVRVFSADGKRLKGQAAKDAIKSARAEKVSNLRKAAGEKKMASLEAEEELKGLVEADVVSKKAAANASVKAYERLEGINANIENLNEGVNLLRKEGANTGVIDKYLPSLKQSTIKLKNLQGRLGLDILRNTTFGSLSAQELRFALDTAFPEGLQPEEAAQWLEVRIKAQEKLADYIESAAIYLGTPGNTIKGWLEKKRNEQGRQSAAGKTTDIKFLGFE